MDTRTRREALLLIGAAVTFTVFVAVLPFVRFTYVSASTRVAADTAQALIAGFVAFLLYGRYRRTQSWADLSIVIALALSATTNVITVVIRAASEDESTLTPFAIWSAQSLTLMAAIGFTVAGWAPAGHVQGRRRQPVVLAIAAAVVAMTMLIAVTADADPLTLSRLADPGSSRRPQIDADASLLWLHALVLALRFAAAAGFWRRSIERPNDPILAATAIALVVAGIARINFILYPSLYTNIVHSGDVLRLSFYLILLVGAARELRGYWTDRERLAVVEERNRIARELHDGLNQELSFIRSQTDALRRGKTDPAMLTFVADASERALHESRRAIESLRGRNVRRLDERLRDEVSIIASRSNLEVIYTLEECSLSAEVADHVVRVAREAATNAVRHAGAASLNVTLRSHDGDIILAVADDGSGFDQRRAGDGFGMRTMGDRAELLGGALSIAPGRAGGTCVELRIPGDSVGELIQEEDDVGDVS